MKRGGSKQKGAQFERDICKQLSLWVSHGQREDLFWRSAMSGGRATVGRRAGKDHAKHAGDISATHPLGHLLTSHFYVECKHLKSLEMDSWLMKSAGLMAKHWATACAGADDHNLMPMMIVKQNLWPTLLVVRCTNLLTPNEAGVSFLSPRAFLGRFMRAKADVYDFEGVLQRPFAEPQDRTEFLKPGEVQKILRREPLQQYYDKLDSEIKPGSRKVQRYRG